MFLIQPQQEYSEFSLSYHILPCFSAPLSALSLSQSRRLWLFFIQSKFRASASKPFTRHLAVTHVWVLGTLCVEFSYKSTMYHVAVCVFGLLCLRQTESNTKPSSFSFPGLQSTRVLYFPPQEQSCLWIYSFPRLLYHSHSFQVKRLKVAHVRFPKCIQFDRNMQSWDGCGGEHTLIGRRQRTTFADEPPNLLHSVAKLSTAALALQFAAVVYIEKTR